MLPEEEFVEPVGALVYHNHEKRMYIRVNPQEDREPHFILLDDEPQHTRKKAGLSLFAPRYVKLPLERAKQEWLLDEAGKRELMRILRKQDRLRWKNAKYGKVFYVCIIGNLMKMPCRKIRPCLII